MTIPTIECRGYELRAYSHQEFPLHRTPTPKARAGSHPSRELTLSRSPERNHAVIQRCSAAQVPTNASDAVELAMQFGKDIVDGKIQAVEL